MYHVTNEADLPKVAWKPAPPIQGKGSGGALQPENYFNTQLKSGIPYLRNYNFCRYGTHCTEAPVRPGNVGTGMRAFAMWGNSFSQHWMLTGDEDSGAAAKYCAQMVNGYIAEGPAPHFQHLLTMGIATMMLLRYARAADDTSILQLSHSIWKHWPYDWERHSLATQPNVGGTDTTPNDTHNMKAVGACAAWLLGKYMGDSDLMEKGKDCIMNFILPNLLPEGYWLYRPGSPEGEIVDGVQSNNHYDGFVKQLLSRLLMYPEWREIPGVMDALRRGMDFTIGKLSEVKGNELLWELHRDAHYGPRETLARYIGHAGMLTEPVWVLAKYCDASYLKPLQQSVQYAYNRRDDELMKDYWDNAWFYSIYVGLFTLSGLGVKFEGEPDNLQLDISATTEPVL
jgi:hypothetical protein